MTGRITAVVVALLVIAGSVLTVVIQRSREERITNLNAFVDLSFGAAREMANADERILVLDFMAQWCKPCQDMDATTWRDPKILRWVNDHGLAIQIDVDHERDLARQFGVTAMPTIILLDERNDEVFRHVGYLSADALVTALESAKSKAPAPGITTPTSEGEG